LDLHPSERAGGSPHHNDAGADELGADDKPVLDSPGGGGCRSCGLVAAEVTRPLPNAENLRKAHMKSRGLILASLVLAALSGTLYWSNHRKPAESSPKASVETPPKLLTINQADITAVEIKKKGGEDVTLAKNDAGKWQITSPKELGADRDAVSSMLSTLSSLGADRLIEEKADNLEP